MNLTPPIIAQRILLIAKLDATAIYQRLSDRWREAVRIYASKRTQQHFSELFKTKYDSLAISEMKYLGAEVIVELNRFYEKVGELQWFLYHTEEMPAAVEDTLSRKLVELKSHLENLTLYVEAEIETIKEQFVQN